MKEIYTAPNEEAGLAALDSFEKKWGSKYSYAIKSWSGHSIPLVYYKKYFST